MASNTNNLGLLKKDPVADGNDTFNVRTMLNENWDKIDAAIGDVATPAAAMGLTKHTVGDALNVLAHVGNLHVWERVQTYAEEQHTYTLGEKATGVVLATGTGAGYQQIWYCSDKITVSDSLEISLVSPSTVNFYSNTTTEEFMSAVAGKFIKYKGHGSEAGLTLSYAGVYFCPGDSAFGNVQYSQYEVYKGITNAQIVTAVTIPAGTHVDYLTSTDRNAYPDNVTDAQDAYYTLGDVVSGIIVPVATSQVQFKYSTTVTVYDNGDLNVDGDVVNLQNYNTEGTSTIKGKYIVPVTTGASISGVWFIPSDATFSLISVDGDATKRYLYCDKMQPVTGHAATPANTTITYLGQLGGGARIEVGSYVGTGTYGSSNPNTLTFGFEPKLLIIRNAGSSKEYLFLSAVKSGRYVSFSLSGSGSSVGSYTGVITLSGNIVSWYADNSQAQMNLSDNTFHYIALG